MKITIAPDGTPPSDQVREQVRALVSSGRLAADERLPPVRQLAADLGVAPGTVAKAYKTLESEGVLVTRVGAGTRVSAQAASTPHEVEAAARALAAVARESDLSLEAALGAVRAVWDDEGAVSPRRPADR